MREWKLERGATVSVLQTVGGLPLHAMRVSIYSDSVLVARVLEKLVLRRGVGGRGLYPKRNNSSGQETANHGKQTKIRQHPPAMWRKQGRFPFPRSYPAAITLIARLGGEMAMGVASEE